MDRTVDGQRRRLLCFGDSNTYGYDPRSYGGGRYPSAARWTDLLARETGWEVHNHGQNGREIPHGEAELAQAAALFAGGYGLAIVMLGSNDLLQHPSFTAGDVAARMEVFLRRMPHVPLLLAAPPPMRFGAWVAEARLVTESAQLGRYYAALARRLGTGFLDAGGWSIPLAFDGVHFSAEGHRRFAAELLARRPAPL